VVIWDGQCNFCRQQVVRLRKLDWTGRLTFLSLHDPRVGERYPLLTHEQLMAEMWVVLPDGRMFGGADALRALSRVLPALWPIAPLLHLPLTMPLWRGLYRWVARNRYRLAGKNCDGGTCALHASKR
jgi:predicted DCC family thiol-disulfide oxidoreductase YuxK